MKVKVIDWADNYRAFFGPLSSDQAAAWAQVLYDNTGCKDAHIDQVVASMCSNWDVKEYGKPGIKVIMKKIFNIMGKGSVWFMDANEVIKRGKAMLDKCIKTDWNSMSDIICVDHQAWKIERMAAVKMWKKSISVALEDYAKRTFGYDSSKVTMPNWKNELSKLAIGMTPDVSEDNEPKQAVKANYEPPPESANEFEYTDACKTVPFYS